MFAYDTCYSAQSIYEMCHHRAIEIDMKIKARVGRYAPCNMGMLCL